MLSCPLSTSQYSPLPAPEPVLLRVRQFAAKSHPGTVAASDGIRGLVNRAGGRLYAEYALIPFSLPYAYLWYYCLLHPSVTQSFKQALSRAVAHASRQLSSQSPSKSAAQPMAQGKFKGTLSLGLWCQCSLTIAWQSSAWLRGRIKSRPGAGARDVRALQAARAAGCPRGRVRVVGGGRDFLVK